MNRVCKAGFLVALLLSPATGLASGPCRPLFNERNLDGWTVLGPAQFEAVQGVIRGTPVDSESNTFLATDETFGDFDLRLQFRFEAGMFNSGVQFRSARYERETPVRFRSGSGDWQDATMAAGRVHGYQAEIDPSVRAWTAEIYHEAARGWLQAPDEQPAWGMIEPGRWHDLRIRAQGHRIQTWLNDQPIAELEDDARASGFIALQVHGVYEPEQVGKVIEFRALQLCAP